MGIVPTGQVVWNLGPTRTSVDWVRHLDHVATQFPLMKRFDWVVDNLNTHWSLEVCQWVAQRSGIPVVSKALQTGPERRTFLSDPSHKHVFHFTPIHGSWLNQVELFFSVLSRRFLKRGEPGGIGFPTVEKFDFPRIEKPVRGIAFSSDGKTLASRLTSWSPRPHRAHRGVIRASAATSFATFVSTCHLL